MGTQLRKSSSTSTCVVALTTLLALTGCAAMVETHPTRFTVAPKSELGNPGDLRIDREMVVALPTGYERRLVAGSVWRRVGDVPEGVVYKPVDSVFTIEGRQVHEAYLVIKGGALRGFYLPAEASYSPLPASVSLNQGKQP